eukprot:TRINITY_DN3687_c4_g1_i1.p1 TRINITY_DN3687_c4_g1~~TRINITY_DN3687_c4_g1_i1.p1  ORF type:complete len:182 (+),score=24.55 TRINITY_DN3687_c4_g1_i1:49-594(+)
MVGVDPKKLSVLQLREVVNKLYDTDPLQLKVVVDRLLDELADSRSELARQDDTLHSLMMDLHKAQDEALRLGDFVSRDILTREYEMQGAKLAAISPVSPPDSRIRSPTLDFSPQRFHTILVDSLNNPPQLYRILSDLADATQWQLTTEDFKRCHPNSCLTTLVVNACPRAEELLRARGVVL